MTQGKASESGVNLAMVQLRTALQTSSDEALGMFMHGYALGLVSDVLMSMMTAPNQRSEFLTAIAKVYPDDWKRAIEGLKNFP
jgi:hypothetical protein